MTEADWAIATPGAMLRYLAGAPSKGAWLRGWLAWRNPQAKPPRAPNASARKLRLYACACCRAVWSILRDGRSRDALEAAEGYADGAIDEECLAAARTQAWVAVEALQPNVLWTVNAVESCGGVSSGKLWAWAARAVASSLDEDSARAAVETDRAVERAGVEWASEITDAHGVACRLGARTRAAWLRDIFGNPFCAPVIQPCWRTPNVVAASEHAYRKRGLPHGLIARRHLVRLSDALEQAGCDNDDILDHLGSRGPHVRGCYVLDLLLDKI